MIDERAPTGGGDILGGIGAIVGAGASIYNTIATNKANKKMAEYQYSKDLEMWNRGNEYNSPQMQMQRMMAAGLNPNMVYGSGNVAGNQSGQLPKYQAPRMEYNFQAPDLRQIPLMLSAFQDARIKQEQTDNLQAQRRLLEEELHKKRFTNWLNSQTGSSQMQTYWDKGRRQATMASREEMETEKVAELYKYDLEFRKGMGRHRDIQDAKTIQDMERTQTQTEFEKLKMSWYETQMLSSLGGAAAGIITKVLPRIFKGARKVPGAQVPGKSFNQKSRQAENAFNETTKRMKDFGKRN